MQPADYVVFYKMDLDWTCCILHTGFELDMVHFAIWMYAVQADWI